MLRCNLYHELLGLLATMLLCTSPCLAEEPIEVQSVLIRLIDQVEVPAREAGVLAEIDIQEGQHVEKGETLARLEDDDARLAVEKAQLELEAAQMKAGNDVSIRFADKALAVARAELSRSKESIALFPKSISQSQIDVEQLTVDKTGLELEQARHQLDLEKQEARVKKNELAIAEYAASRRQIVAPFDGMVVQRKVQRGEWVEPGETVARLLRLDRLRAEGFIDADLASRELLGAKVQLVARVPGDAQAYFPGKIVFISPEVDPVNHQVRIWAEIENGELRLRPGQRAQMSIVD